jgi:predicted transcriptional regulator
MPRREKESVIYAWKRADREVMDMLLPPGDRHRWSNLLSQARKIRMGPTTLKNHLDKLIQVGLVSREVEDTDDGPAVYYSRRDPLLFPETFMEVYRLKDDLRKIGKIAQKAKTKEKTLEIYDVTSRVHTYFAQSALPALLYASLSGKGPYGINAIGEKSEEEVEEMFDQMMDDMHELADELLDNVIRPWIHDMLNVFGSVPYDFRDTLENETASILRKAVSNLKEYDNLLKPFRVETSVS